MDKLKKMIKQFSLKGDIIITLMGITLLTSLIIVFIDPTNKAALFAACIAGGLLNSLQGFKIMGNSKNKSSGMSLVLLGIILIIAGFIIINYNSLT